MRKLYASEPMPPSGTVVRFARFFTFFGSPSTLLSTAAGLLGIVIGFKFLTSWPFEVDCGFACKIVGLAGEIDVPAASVACSYFETGRAGCSEQGDPSSPFSKVKMDA